MPKLSISPERKKQIALTLGGGLAFLFWLVLFFIPQLGNWIQKRPEIQALENQLLQAHQRLDQFSKREKELSRLKTQYELSGAVLPHQQQLPDLLEGIAQAAKSAGVRLEAVKPKLDIGQLEAGASGYLELPLEVNAVGGYHPLGLFLDTLERSDSLIRVQEFKIRTDMKDIWNHQATFILQSYLLPSVSPSSEK